HRPEASQTDQRSKYSNGQQRSESFSQRGDGGTCDPQLIKIAQQDDIRGSRRKRPAAAAAAAKEEANAPSARRARCQREMLKDPRFGSPLLCDARQRTKVWARATTTAWHCAAFSFSLLGLRSASLHLINGTDITEDRVLYILDKFGGSVWIPKVPEVLQVEAGGSLAQQPTTSAGLDETCKLMLDPHVLQRLPARKSATDWPERWRSDLGLGQSLIDLLDSKIHP
uniref:SET domain-containing protein n=1 Tax=Macrostomum lignano TaxID=282301 RepID=A0A1I8FPG6_9PLAT